MSPEVPKAVIEHAGRVVYACRRWQGGHRPGTMQMACADCGAKVAVTPSVLADRRRQVHAVGRSLAVVCDDCALQAVLDAGAMIASFPSPDEIASA